MKNRAKKLNMPHSISNNKSTNDLRETVNRMMAAAPIHSEQNHILKTTWIETPLGLMIAIADNDVLYLLEFIERKGLEREVSQIRRKIKTTFIPGTNPVIKAIGKEVKQYFEGKLKCFSTPVFLLGSPFQTQVWEQLRQIPFGKTCSYADLARAIDKPTACRAVANANGANQFAIMIPCHRVINTNGGLGGYGGGIERKKWLIDHELAQ